MKTEAIQKINKIGKISNVITLIAKILVGIGMVLSIIGAVICFVIPESMLKMSVVGEIVMEVDYSALGVTIPQNQMKLAKDVLASEISEDEKNDFSEFEITEEKVMLRGDLEDYSFTMRDVAWLVVLAMIALVMTFITLIFVGGLCKAFRDCNSPFETNVIRKMQNLAIALIPWTITSTITNSVSESIKNSKLSLLFTVDLGVILVVLVVLVLVYIFKYGALLQQESDETL